MFGKNVFDETLLQHFGHLSVSCDFTREFLVCLFISCKYVLVAVSGIQIENSCRDSLFFGVKVWLQWKLLMVAWSEWWNAWIQCFSSETKRSRNETSGKILFLRLEHRVDQLHMRKSCDANTVFCKNDSEYTVLLCLRMPWFLKRFRKSLKTQLSSKLLKGILLLHDNANKEKISDLLKNIMCVIILLKAQTFHVGIFIVLVSLTNFQSGSTSRMMMWNLQTKNTYWTWGRDVFVEGIEKLRHGLIWV